MKDVLRLASKPFNKYEPHPYSLSRACDAFALDEVHTLHALREHDLVDGTLRVRRRREGKGYK